MARICTMGKRRNEVAHPAEVTATGRAGEEVRGAAPGQGKGSEGRLLMPNCSALTLAN